MTHVNLSIYFVVQNSDEAKAMSWTIGLENGKEVLILFEDHSNLFSFVML